MISINYFSYFNINIQKYVVKCKLEFIQLFYSVLKKSPMKERGAKSSLRDLGGEGGCT